MSVGMGTGEAAEIVVRTKNGGERKLTAFPTSHPNIVIHRGPYSTGSNNERFGLWNVTHAPTGLSILQFLPNKECAEKAAEWAARQDADWNAAEETVVKKSFTQRLMEKQRVLETMALDVSADLADLYETLSEAI